MMSSHRKYLLICIFSLFLLFFIPFWKSITMSVIFSLAITFLIHKFKKDRIISFKLSLFIVFLVSFFIIIPMSFGIYGLSSQIAEITKNSKDQNPQISFFKSVEKFQEFSGVDIANYINNSDVVKKVGASVSEYIFNMSINILKAIPDLIVDFIVFTLSLFFLLFYGDKIKQFFLNLKILNKADVNELIEVSQKSSYECLIVLLIVGAIQSLIVTVGAAVTKFDSLSLIFIVTFLFSFIPVIGAAPIAFALAMFRVVSGEFDQALILAVVGSIAGAIDNILKPLFVTKGEQLDGSIALIALLGSIVLFGLPGLLIGPVISSMAAHYFKKINNH